MRFSAQGSVSVPWLGAAFLLLALGVALTSPAQAGCSAYVTTSDPHGQVGTERSGFELLDRAGALPTPENESVPDRRKPCTGALCSGNPGLPHHGVPAVPVHEVEQWATLPLRISPDPFGFRAFLLLDEALAPIDFGASIFHPPRPTFSISPFGSSSR